MPILLEIQFYILWAINPAFTFLPIQTDFCLNGITLIQYRDTLIISISLGVGYLEQFHWGIFSCSGCVHLLQNRWFCCTQPIVDICRCSITLQISRKRIYAVRSVITRLWWSEKSLEWQLQWHLGSGEYTNHYITPISTCNNILAYNNYEH